MHIRVMTDPQAYLKTTGGGSGGAANTELARQLITGSLSAESQIAKAANSSAPNADAGGSVKLSRWSPMLLLTGPCADIYDEVRARFARERRRDRAMLSRALFLPRTQVVQELVRAREHAHEVRGGVQGGEGRGFAVCVRGCAVCVRRARARSPSRDGESGPRARRSVRRSPTTPSSRTASS